MQSLGTAATHAAHRSGAAKSTSYVVISSNDVKQFGRHHCTAVAIGHEPKPRKPVGYADRNALEYYANLRTRRVEVLRGRHAGQSRRHRQVFDSHERIAVALMKLARRGKSDPTALEIAKMVGHSVSTVRRALVKLQSLGIVVITPRFDPMTGHQTSSSYDLRPPTEWFGYSAPSWLRAAPPPEPDTLGLAKPAVGTLTHNHVFRNLSQEPSIDEAQELRKILDVPAPEDPELARITGQLGETIWARERGIIFEDRQINDERKLVPAESQTERFPVLLDDKQRVISDAEHRRLLEAELSAESNSRRLSQRQHPPS